MFSGLSNTVAAVLGVIAGAALALVIFSTWNWAVDNPSVRREARAQERAAWEEASRKLRDQMERERRAAQAQIDRLEQDYLADRSRAALQIMDLETAIASMEGDEDAIPDTAGCVCRPAIPRGLGLQLDQVGR